MATDVGAQGSRTDQGFEACGSPGEIANDPNDGHRYWMWLTTQEKGQREVRDCYQPNNGKRIVWTMAALTAADQLRQRVAWALSQIVVVGEERACHTRTLIRTLQPLIVL